VQMSPVEGLVRIFYFLFCSDACSYCDSTHDEDAQLRCTGRLHRLIRTLERYN
jgi:hypothetical protein